jgi:hypothetical protein
MKTDINSLREHLFATIEALRDDEKPMDIQRAKAISDVAQTIINSAKVEVDFANATGQQVDSKFLPSTEKPPQAVQARALPRAVK